MSENVEGQTGRDGEPQRLHEEELALVASLWSQRLTQTEIGVRLGLSQPTVSRRLKELSERYRKAGAADYAEAVGKAVADLDEVIRLAYQAYHRSTLPATSISKTIGDEGSSVTKKRVGQAGSASLLATVIAALKERAELLCLKNRQTAQDEDHLPELEVVMGDLSEDQLASIASLRTRLAAAKAA